MSVQKAGFFTGISRKFQFSVYEIVIKVCKILLGFSAWQRDNCFFFVFLNILLKISNFVELSLGATKTLVYCKIEPAESYFLILRRMFLRYL